MKALETHSEAWLSDLGVSTLHDLVWSYTQPDSSGSMEFSHFWAGMEDMLQVIGRFHDQGDAAQRGAVDCLRFVRDCLLETDCAWTHTSPPRMWALKDAMEPLAFHDCARPCAEDLVRVSVRTLAGAAHTIQVGCLASVRTAKHCLAALTGTPVVQQCLMHGDCLLADEETPFASADDISLLLVVVPLKTSTQGNGLAFSASEIRNWFERAANVVGRAGRDYAQQRIQQLPDGGTAIREADLNEALLVWLEDVLVPETDSCAGDLGFEAVA